jgi:signal transduction histidine kinase
MPLSPVPAEMGAIVRGVLEELRTAHPDCPIDVDMEGDLSGRWDPARIAQLLTNLLGNALNYRTAGTPVRLSAKQDGAQVRVQVENQGTPIPPATLSVLFEPFRRGLSGEREREGLGLGLHIAREIVVAHGGTIEAESNGTTIFSVRLPRTPPAPKERTPAL